MGLFTKWIRSSVLVATAGVAVATGIFVFGSGVLDRGSLTAAPTDGRPHYVLLAAGGIPEGLRTSPDVSSVVQFSLPASMEEAQRLMFDRAIAGIVMDRYTFITLPQGAAARWYAAGKVIAVFNVGYAEVLRAANSHAAFPDVDDRFVPDRTKKPDNGGIYTEPFFSIVYRSRPGTDAIVGGETTMQYSVALFAYLLRERALNAQGLVTVDGAIRPSGAGGTE